MYQVQIPHGLNPGQTFNVNLAGQIMAVTVPPNATGGQMLQIKAPQPPPVAGTTAAYPAAQYTQNATGQPTGGAGHPGPLVNSFNNQPHPVEVAEIGRQMLNQGYGTAVTQQTYPVHQGMNGVPQMVSSPQQPYGFPQSASSVPQGYASHQTSAIQPPYGAALPPQAQYAPMSNVAQSGKIIVLPAGFQLPSPQHATMDWHQTFGLNTNEDYYLDSSVKSVKFGLAWDAGCDVDGSVALFDGNGNCADIIWYRQLHSIFSKAVEHSGDDRTGAGGGDDEVIKIRLRKLPIKISYALCCVCVFNRSHSLQNVRSLKVSLYHGSKKPSKHGKILCQYNVSQAKLQGSSMLVAMLVRKGAWWCVRALGQSYGNYNEVLTLVRSNPGLRDLLLQSPSSPPLRATITVIVRQGRNLKGKDVNGQADPFIKMKFRKFKTENEKVRKTLNPVWPKPASLIIPEVDAADVKKLTISVWDWDRFSSSDFMGRIKLPAAALFNLGYGSHQKWVQVSPDPKRFHGYSVGGELLLEIHVQQETALTHH